MLTSGPDRAVTPMNSLHLCLPAQDLQKMVPAKFPSQMKEGQIRLLTSQCNSWKFLVSGEGVSLPPVLQLHTPCTSKLPSTYACMQHQLRGSQAPRKQQQRHENIKELGGKKCFSQGRRGMRKSNTGEKQPKCILDFICICGTLKE